jgi:porin
VDVYPFASPWSGFSNFAFVNGGGSIGGIPDGAFGAMVGGFLTKQIYLTASVADANGDATDLRGGFDSFFNDFETFKSLEFGWAPNADEFFLNNAHLTFWQIDERTMVGTPDGWGASFSLSASLGNGWMPFLRGGWADDGGSFYEANVSTGFGFTRNPGRSMLGLGLNWCRPNESTYGSNLDDQVALELFQHLQLTEAIEITPSIQMINNPALNTGDDSTVVFGLRIRVAF